jgi:20S proteasome subunit alpha 4
MARFIAKTQQKFTQRGGVRPFGVSSMLTGFAPDGSPQLYLTDPAGTFSAWKANAIGGRNEKAVKEFLEVKSVWISTELEMPDPFIRKY